MIGARGLALAAAAAGLAAAGYYRGPVPTPQPAAPDTKRCAAGHRLCKTGKAASPGCGCCACCLNVDLYPDGCGCTGCYQKACVCSRPLADDVHCRECA